jgi:hypothetical protein
MSSQIDNKKKTQKTVNYLKDVLFDYNWNQLKRNKLKLNWMKP